jgi:hypothetical protein
VNPERPPNDRPSPMRGGHPYESRAPDTGGRTEPSRQPPSPELRQVVDELAHLEPHVLGWENAAEYLLDLAGLVPRPADPLPDLPDSQRRMMTLAQMSDAIAQHVGIDAALRWIDEYEAYRRAVKQIVRRWRRRRVL